MAILNQYSAVLFALGGAVILGIGMWRLHRPSQAVLRLVTLGLYCLLALVLIASIQFPSSNTEIDNMEQIERLINNGRPTFVMMYSHFCVGCIASLPAMQNLDDELAQDGQALDLVFLDIHSALGRVARETLGFDYTPTYILYNAAGDEVMRTHTTPTVDIIR